MPTISFIQPKGGAEISALILATELAKSAKVIVIDADPNAPIAKWSSRKGASNLEIVQAGKEDSIFDLIEEAEKNPLCHRGHRRRCRSAGRLHDIGIRFRDHSISGLGARSGQCRQGH